MARNYPDFELFRLELVTWKRVVAFKLKDIDYEDITIVRDGEERGPYRVQLDVRGMYFCRKGLGKDMELYVVEHIDGNNNANRWLAIPELHDVTGVYAALKACPGFREYVHFGKE